MKTEALGAWSKRLRGVFGRYKFVLLVILAGAALLLLPSVGEKETAAEQTAEQTSLLQSVDALERRLEAALSRMDGAGEVTVVLTVKSSGRQILAQDGKTTERGETTDTQLTTVVVSRGSGSEEPVALQQLSPQYQGALVVCSGGDADAVRLKIVEAVSALTRTSLVPPQGTTMKVWKRNAVVAAIVLFVCVAVYLNWSYQKEGGDAAETGKTLGEAALVSGQTADPLLGGTQTAQPGASGSPSPTGAAQASGSDYFASARLNRQQARDSALAILQDALANEDLDETMRADNSQAIQTLASATVSEAQIENLVTAKGYSDCVAFISDESVSVVVSATESGLTDADVAKITEIVTDETGCAASQVKIIEAS